MENNKIKKQRNPTFDVARFLVMLLVVSGHLTGNHIVACEPGVSYLSNANIGMAMPLFFMISGYFVAKTFDAGDVGKITARVIGFLWPLATFGAIFGILLFLFDKIPLWKAVLYPVARVCFGSWFLKTLAVIYIVVAVLWKFFKASRWRIVAVISIYVALFFTAGQGKISSLLGISNVLHMYPYFILGIMALRPFEMHNDWRIAIPCGMIFGVAVLLEGDVSTNGMAFYWVPSDWQTVLADRHLFLCFWARTIVGTAGSFFLLWSLERLIKLVPQLLRIAVFGTTTLGVYVLHEWPLVQIDKYFQFEPLPNCWRWPLTMAVFMICHFAVIAIKRHHRLNFIFFGDEKWLAAKVDMALPKCFSL